jgi:hypothetical protein
MPLAYSRSPAASYGKADAPVIPAGAPAQLS